MMSLMAVGFALYAVTPESAAGRPVVAVGGALATFGIGAAFPMLMDGVISGAPPERAASSAALAQLANELGIALGLTVLGSLGTVVYRMRLGLPGSAAEQSVIDGIREGRHHPDLLDGVRSSFTDAFHVAGIVGVVLMIVVLVLVARATREASAPDAEDLPELEAVC
jgi:DHA2 family multidrug resistance protein-like MFS transporter